MSYIYFYGYDCYGYGCLTEPPGAQLPDPNPLPDIEADYVPPTTYTSTQSYTATCPEGTVQRAVAHTIDVTGPVPPSISGSVATGFPPAFEVVSVNVTPTESSNGNVTIKLEGSSDSVSYVTLVESGEYVPLAGVTASFQVPLPIAYAYYRCTVTNSNALISSPGNYAFELLTATGTGITATATETSLISQQDAIQKAYNAAVADAESQLAVLGCAVVYTSTQTVTVACTVGLGSPVTITATRTSLISQADADDLAHAAAQAEADALLDCAGSNNTEEIVINDSVGPVAPATPYPSVSFKSGLTGVLTRIRVNILGLTHNSPEDVMILVQSPANKYVYLMQGCGGVNPISTAVDLTFDSDSATPLPNTTQIVSGTFSPSVYGAQTPFAAPVPAPAYLTSFATLIGDSPNGVWNIWVCDRTSLDSGLIANGWTLTLDTA